MDAINVLAAMQSKSQSEIPERTTAESAEPRRSLKCQALSTVETQEIQWLWKGRIPENTLSIVEGDGGRGKSTIIADVCSRLSRGERLQDDDTERPPKKILLLAAEDDPASVLRPRFERHAADLDRVLFDDQAMILNRDGLDALKDAIRKHAINVVVIDPIVAFMGQKLDMNKGNDVRSILGPLVTLGRESACTFIVVRHFNKGREGSASQRGAGSVDFRNAARSVLQVIHSEDCSYLALEKSNYAAKAKTLAFTIENGRVKWGEASDISADQLHSENQTGAESKSSVEDAIEFLKTELTGVGKPAKEITKGAYDLGISTKTLQRAKKHLGVESEKVGLVWHWRIRLDDANEHGQDGQHSQVSQPDLLGHLGHLDLLGANGTPQETVI